MPEGGTNLGAASITAAANFPNLTRAVALHRQGRLGDAERFYKASLKTEGDYFPTLQQFGLLRLQQGKTEDGVKLLRRAAQAATRPAGAALAPVFHNLGMACLSLGRSDEAIAAYREALALNPDLPETQNNLGLALQVKGEIDEAIALYQRALAHRPDFPAALNNLGNALHLSGRNQEAVPNFERALALSPRNLEVRTNFGNLLVAMGRFDEAITHFQTALALDPKAVDTIHSLGRALNLCGRTREAIEEWRRVLVIAPGHVEALNGIGEALRDLGDLDGAVAHFGNALAVAPRSGRSYRNLALSRRLSAGDQVLGAMARLAREESSLPEEEGIELAFALGKAYADAGDYDKSFAHLAAGNRRKRARIRYDEASTMAAFAEIEAAFTPALYEATAGFGDTSRRPVFVLGMPRSGTTLVEQILGSHPKAFGAGELPALNLIAGVLAQKLGRGFPEAVADLGRDDAAVLGAHYLDIVRRHTPASAERVIDKMPANFLRAGLIPLLLPNARIIHTRRDPRDVAVSCFSTLFGVGQEFSYDLGELARYIRAYQKLMAHWRRVLPAAVMLEVDYEALTADLPGNARAIVAHCGLEWNEACLAFHRTERLVKTASAVQVRQPLYTSSVGRWRAYERHLGPLLAELGTP